MKTLSLSKLFCIAAALLVAGLNTTVAAEMPKVGDKAPVITGKDESGKDWNLSERIGKKVVLPSF